MNECVICLRITDLVGIFDLSTHDILFHVTSPFVFSIYVVANKVFGESRNIKLIGTQLYVLITMNYK